MQIASLKQKVAKSAKAEASSGQSPIVADLLKQSASDAPLAGLSPCALQALSKAEASSPTSPDRSKKGSSSSLKKSLTPCALRHLAHAKKPEPNSGWPAGSDATVQLQSRKDSGSSLKGLSPCILLSLSAINSAAASNAGNSVFANHTGQPGGGGIVQRKSSLESSRSQSTVGCRHIADSEDGSECSVHSDSFAPGSLPSKLSRLARPSRAAFLPSLPGRSGARDGKSKFQLTNTIASMKRGSSSTFSLSVKRTFQGRSPYPSSNSLSGLAEDFAASVGTDSTSHSLAAYSTDAGDPSSSPSYNRRNSLALMGRPPLQNFRKRLDHSWIQHLSPEDPHNREQSIATYTRPGGHPGRPVMNGHYVRVRPTPLANPSMVIYSPELALELGFAQEEVLSEPFLKYFSGDVDGAFQNVDFDTDDLAPVETWATPYALSIMGRRYTSNCPYGTGDGYGDGRAISVGEIVVPLDDSEETASYPLEARRYELQLKGGGQTPFCRGADGRAILRSSIREFLASEAMYHLGVCTTRALSLIVSDGIDGDTSTRPWYSDGAMSKVPALPSMNDPRLAKYSETQRREIINQMAAQAKADPDTLVEEKCAITTRVSSSFIRVGHFDLFARRVELWQMRMAKARDHQENTKSSSSNDASSQGSNSDAEAKESKEVDAATAIPVRQSNEYQELEELLWHACYREYYHDAYLPYWESKDAQGAAVALMEASMARLSNTVAGWVRVGFVQGNFNADNCLVGGRTMDYGPFGFLDVYHPLSAKWTGSGEHFGFMNQPSAGYANFAVLVESLLPIIDAHGGNADEVRDAMLEKAQSYFSDSVDLTIRTKMGLELGPPTIAGEADALWEDLEPLLRTARGDWTLFWRQLTYVAEKYTPSKFVEAGNEIEDETELPDYDEMLSMLMGNEDIKPGSSPFYDPLSEGQHTTLRSWIERWHKALTQCYNFLADDESSEYLPPGERMRLVNPKYVLREWMLVEAYSKADVGKFIAGDYSTVDELFLLSKDPYGEGTPENHDKYYRRAPDESLRAGGTAFMS